MEQCNPPPPMFACLHVWDQPPATGCMFACLHVWVRSERDRCLANVSMISLGQSHALQPRRRVIETRWWHLVAPQKFHQKRGVRIVEPEGIELATRALALGFSMTGTKRLIIKSVPPSLPGRAAGLDRRPTCGPFGEVQVFVSFVSFAAGRCP